MDIARAETWVRQLNFVTDNSMLVPQSMETKTQSKGEKGFRANKPYLAKTTRILPATSDLADSKKDKRQPKIRRNNLPSLSFRNNTPKHLVHCPFIQLIQTEGVNRRQGDHIHPVHNKVVREPIPAPAHNQKSNLMVVILPMLLTMPP